LPHGFYKDRARFRTFDFARANQVRKYGADWEQNFRDLTHRRIHAWGLNTVANWSDARVYLLDRTPYTVCLNTSGPRIEGSAGWWGKFPDPFSHTFGDGIRKRALEQRTVGTTDDPWCIGYFVDNELSWAKTTATSRVPLSSRPPRSPPKSLSDLAGKENTDARSAEYRVGHIVRIVGSPAAATNTPDEQRCGADLEAFHAQIAETYFRVIRDAVRTAAPTKLYLGCRIAWGAPSVYRAAAKFCDVVSVNTTTRRHQRSAAGRRRQAHDQRRISLGAWTRHLPHGPRSHEEPTGPRRLLQSVRDLLSEASPLRGAHWFQWRDQPLTGRGDGEDFQFGF
jgi:hypothetical protein